MPSWSLVSSSAESIGGPPEEGGPGTEFPDFPAHSALEGLPRNLLPLRIPSPRKAIGSSREEAGKLGGTRRAGGAWLQPRPLTTWAASVASWSRSEEHTS